MVQDVLPAPPQVFTFVRPTTPASPVATISHENVPAAHALGASIPMTQPHRHKYPKKRFISFVPLFRYPIRGGHRQLPPRPQTPQFNQRSAASQQVFAGRRTVNNQRNTSKAEAYEYSAHRRGERSNKNLTIRTVPRYPLGITACVLHLPPTHSQTPPNSSSASRTQAKAGLFRNPRFAVHYRLTRRACPVPFGQCHAFPCHILRKRPTSENLQPRRNTPALTLPLRRPAC